ASRRMRCTRAAASQSGQHGKITADQRLLLVAAPAFDLGFGCRGVVEPIEMLVRDQLYGTAEGCVAAKGTGLMLGDATFKTADSGAHIIRAVSTAKNVEKGAAHGCAAVRPSRRPLRGLLRMT